MSKNKYGEIWNQHSISSDRENQNVCVFWIDIYSISLYISSISFSKYLPNSGRLVFIVGVKRLFSIENCSGWR